MSSQNEQVLVINLTNVQQHVDIINGNIKTSVNIMPRKRVHLEEGFSVCANWQGRNPNAVKTYVPEAKQETSQALTVSASETNDKE